MAAAYPVEQAADTIDDASNTSTDVHDVLVFPDNIRIASVRDSDGAGPSSTVFVEGHWYGLVNDPSDVDRVVHAVTVDKQPVVPSLWRGCINASKATQLALHREVACEDSAATALV
ncbi:hypothetical protein DYB37_000529 [Aphanomyces astaci]|uniref:Uncharacterized protein n=1 Tax=Aphanomyces astaci TaxID=112090 RepID=A0A3R6Y597_APHAT|nr:hypothetical protein DYB35_000473 [Aphanomyces astaci]RHZ21379.1 hypothetical protein DYB37_000529 [Aphanomyces astaci]